MHLLLPACSQLVLFLPAAKPASQQEQNFSSLLLEKYPIGGHRDGKLLFKFNVIFIYHSEFKYGVCWPPGGAIWEIGDRFWPFYSADN